VRPVSWMFGGVGGVIFWGQHVTRP
jgi:hypothetical protein